MSGQRSVSNRSASTRLERCRGEAGSPTRRRHRGSPSPALRMLNRRPPHARCCRSEGPCSTGTYVLRGLPRGPARLSQHPRGSSALRESTMRGSHASASLPRGQHPGVWVGDGYVPLIHWPITSSRSCSSSPAGWRSAGWRRPRARQVGSTSVVHADANFTHECRPGSVLPSSNQASKAPCSVGGDGSGRTKTIGRTVQGRNRIDRATTEAALETLVLGFLEGVLEHSGVISGVTPLALPALCCPRSHAAGALARQHGWRATSRCRCLRPTLAALAQPPTRSMRARRRVRSRSAQRCRVRRVRDPPG
jgi:hypothetical protein